MKRIRFTKEGTSIEEVHKLDMVAPLSEARLKEVLLGDGRPNALLIVSGWNEFEQFIEYETFNTEYGDREVILIHLVKKSNLASYFALDCSISGYDYDERQVAECKEKNKELLITFVKPKYHYFKKDLFKAGILDLGRVRGLELKLECFHEGWPIKDGQFENNLFYVSEKISFCVPISQTIWELYQALPNELKIDNTEDHYFRINFKTGIVEFGFGWEKHISRKGRQYTSFSGQFSLLDFSGSIANTGTNGYHDYGVT